MQERNIIENYWTHLDTKRGCESVSLKLKSFRTIQIQDPQTYQQQWTPMHKRTPNLHGKPRWDLSHNIYEQELQFVLRLTASGSKLLSEGHWRSSVPPSKIQRTC